MFDLSALAPFLVGFFVVAAVATTVAVVTLVMLALERRRPARPILAISAAHPAAASADRRAA